MFCSLSLPLPLSSIQRITVISGVDSVFSGWCLVLFYLFVFLYVYVCVFFSLSLSLSLSLCVSLVSVKSEDCQLFSHSRLSASSVSSRLETR